MNCGAAMLEETGACAYCGTHVDHGATNVPAAVSDRASAKIERFDRLASHPDFDKWMRHRAAPAARPRTGAAAAGIISIVAGAFMALVATSLVGSFGTPSIAFFAVAAIFVVRGVAALSAAAPRSGMATHGAAPRPYPALVVAKRMEVSGGQNGGTDYYVTLEFRTGSRREYDVDGSFYGLVADDDIGISYIREGALESFKQIGV